MNFVLIDEQQAHELRMQVQSRRGVWEEVAFGLKQWGEQSLEKGPWSVTFSERHAISGDPHDYFSQGPYWWPNPEDPDGPFIRRDGEIYPGRFNDHHSWFSQMADTVLALATSGYYLGEKRFLDRAAYLLQVWFIDPQTRMNPHMRYGQLIPGICDGRPIGLIELGSVDRIVHALGFLSEDPDYAATLSGMRVWIAEMLDWLLLPGGFGEEECRNGNNHSTWCVAHMAVFAAFLDREDVIPVCVKWYREELLPQIAADGSLPKELARTRSYHYSKYALDPFALICEVALKYGINLWHEENAAGGSLKKAAEFMLPYIENPFAWKWPQILGDDTSDSFFLQYAAKRLDLPAGAEINRKRREGYKLIRMQEPMGPLCLLGGTFLA